MAINITVTDGHSPTREPHLKRNSGITVTNSALVPMDEWLQSFERNCEIASSKRGRAHKAKRETANGEIAGTPLSRIAAPFPNRISPCINLTRTRVSYADLRSQQNLQDFGKKISLWT